MHIKFILFWQDMLSKLDKERSDRVRGLQDLDHNIQDQIDNVTGKCNKVKPEAFTLYNSQG
jgi:hypothetical protein